MDIRIKQIDGPFKDLTKDSVFTDYTNQTITAGTAVKITDGGYFTDPITTIHRFEGAIQVWNASTNQWTTNADLFTEDVSYDYYGYNVFIMDVAEPADRIVYFCKDDEIQNLPEYDGAYTRSRINSHITRSNFTSVQTIASTNHGYRIIPMTITTRLNGNERHYTYIGLIQNKDTKKIYFGILSGPANWFSIYIPSNPKAVISQYVIYKDTTFQDIEARVKAIEDALISITAKLDEHDKVLKDLPAIVSAVSSNVSKLYVAR